MGNTKKFCKYACVVCALFAVLLVIVFALEHIFSALGSEHSRSLFVIWGIASVLFVVLVIFVAKYESLLEKREKIIMETMDLCSSFVDAKDPYTSGHSRRVAVYSRKIAEKLGFPKSKCKQIYYAAMLHDIGKCYVPDEILKKPTKLTEEEFNIIKLHPIKGAEMVKNLSSLPDVRDGVLYHHERYDGKGYPNGVIGEDIPIVGRIICVADSYDAMHSSRVYREKMENDEIIEELKRNKGTQFDPRIVDAFLAVLQDIGNFDDLASLPPSDLGKRLESGASPEQVRSKMRLKFKHLFRLFTKEVFVFFAILYSFGSVSS